jgi:hypothetical protein
MALPPPLEPVGDRVLHRDMLSLPEQIADRIDHIDKTNTQGSPHGFVPYGAMRTSQERVHENTNQKIIEPLITDLCCFDRRLQDPSFL